MFNQLIQAMLTVMFMGIVTRAPMVMLQNQNEEEQKVRSRALVWGKHKEVTHGLEDILDRILVLREKLPRYIELIEPYVEEEGLDEIKKLLNPLPSTQDMMDALEVLRDISWRGLEGQQGR